MTEMLQKLLDAVKGLTLTNVVIIAILLILAIPAYFFWRVLHDPNLMGAVFNVYSEIDQPKSECFLAFEQPAGGQGRWVIRAVLAERNAETWYVGTKIKFQPDETAMKAFCDALTGVVNFSRDPYHEQPPTFPGSSKLILPVATPAR